MLTALNQYSLCCYFFPVVGFTSLEIERVEMEVVGLIITPSDPLVQVMFSIPAILGSVAL